MVAYNNSKGAISNPWSITSLKGVPNCKITPLCGYVCRMLLTLFKDVHECNDDEHDHMNAVMMI